MYLIYRLSLLWIQRLVVIHLPDIRTVLIITDQIAAEVVGHSPEEILVHVTESVALSGQYKQVKTFVGSDQGIDNPDSVARMHIVVHVTGHKQKVALEILHDVLVLVDRVGEGSVAFCGNLLKDSVMLLAPPSVIDGVVMVACA